MLDIYERNKGLFYLLAKDFGVRSSDMDDFMQLCYLATCDSRKALERGEYPEAAILRMACKSRYFRWCRENKFVCKLPYNAYKSCKNNFLYSDMEIYDLSIEDNKLNQIENKILIDSFWDIIRDTVGCKNTFILYKRYKEHLTYKEIAECLEIGAERVRQRELRSLKKLQNCKELYELYGGN